MTTSVVPLGERIAGLPEHVVVRQLYLACLSQAAYLVGDARTGRAIAVDPRRDTSEILAAAAEEGLTIESVVQTHFHADFLSGHLELAEATGAEIAYGSVAATEFPSRSLADGEVIDLGGVTVEALHTPGHTPESISLVVRPSADAEPVAVLTGDTLFIGDVGRPDLLASLGATADDLGRQLYASLHRLLELPDEVLVLPAHGA
ncbi:MAG TPA: MBL fold metallo-hydrolase, partial [Aquihabitans sp.]|nr:MBL fold metallo-hydrolase [Aquihabitans sp.]